MLGPSEVVVILGIALIIFGPKKLPEIGKSLGSAMRELRRASNEFMSVVDLDERDEPSYKKLIPGPGSDQYAEHKQEPEAEQQSQEKANRTKAGE